MSIRAEKVASVVKRVLAKPMSSLAMELNAGLATVTSVRMSPDLQIAKVFVSVYGGRISPAKFIDLLESQKAEFRRVVGSEVRLRFTPDLRFFLDDTLEQMEYIQKLLDSAPPASATNNEESIDNN